MKVVIRELGEKVDKKEISTHMMIPILDNEGLRNDAQLWVNGSLAAGLEIIMHNQRIINDKLKKILKQNGKRKLQKPVPMRRLPRGKSGRRKKD